VLRTKGTRFRGVLASVVVFLAGCGSSDSADTSPAEAFRPTPPRLGKTIPSGSPPRSWLTKTDARELKTAALHNRFVRAIAEGNRPRIVNVGPWVSEEGWELIGGSVEIRLSPPMRLVNERLPATISPNRKAPPGTPTLYRFARFSATNVTELDVSVELDGGRAVAIEPSGDGVKVTKIELIGPPPKSPSYEPEPGY
jgi:hypothetical protein